MYTLIGGSNVSFYINLFILLTVLTYFVVRLNLYKLNVNWTDPWWSFPVFSCPVLLTKSDLVRRVWRRSLLWYKGLTLDERFTYVLSLALRVFRFLWFSFGVFQLDLHFLLRLSNKTTCPTTTLKLSNRYGNSCVRSWNLLRNKNLLHIPMDIS